jgi:hypothetical protein
MAVYKIFPEKDATIYSYYPSKNTGLDEILETTTYSSQDLLTGNPQTSRTLIKFSQTELLNISASYVTGSFSSSLKLYSANIEGLAQDTTIYTYPISQSWVMGTGKLADTPSTENGVSWTFRNSSGSLPWKISGFATNTTASYDPNGAVGGGTWYYNLSSSQVFTYSDSIDINMDVTNIVNSWLNSTIPNEGFIIKQATEFINSASNSTTMKFFSIDTNTIYPPCLEYKWRDYTYNTGSSTQTIITNPDLYISLQNNPGTFKTESINKFRINARPVNPARIFQPATSFYTTNYFLPTSSYYAVQDLETNEYIIDFDNQFTQISADSESSYFTLYMNGLEPERYYKIIFKVVFDSNNILILDSNYYFKITK